MPKPCSLFLKSFTRVSPTLKTLSPFSQYLALLCNGKQKMEQKSMLTFLRLSLPKISFDTHICFQHKSWLYFSHISRFSQYANNTSKPCRVPQILTQTHPGCRPFPEARAAGVAAGHSS